MTDYFSEEELEQFLSYEGFRSNKKFYFKPCIFSQFSNLTCCVPGRLSECIGYSPKDNFRFLIKKNSQEIINFCPFCGKKIDVNH